jgi:hypothetical protein
MNHPLSSLLDPHLYITDKRVQFSPALESPTRCRTLYVTNALVQAFISFLLHNPQIESVSIQSTMFTVYAFTKQQFQSINLVCSQLKITFTADIKIYSRKMVRFNETIRIVYI